MNNYRPYSGITPAVKVLIIINAVMYFLTLLVEQRMHISLSAYLGLYLPESRFWAPYQYITHMFMHGSFGHLFFNMFALYMFGRILESVWGTKRFLFYYFVTGLGAALLNSLVGWWQYHNMQEQLQAFQNTPQPELLAEFIRAHISHPAGWVWELIDKWSAHPESVEYIQAGETLFRQVIDSVVNIPTIGASGAIFGILLAFGMLFPNTELFLMFIPIPIKAKYFVLGYGVLEFFLGIQNSASDNVAHFAHLGGMLFGFFLIRYWSRNRRKFY